MQLSFNRRFSKGLSVTSGYTWAHGVDEVRLAIALLEGAYGEGDTVTVDADGGVLTLWGMVDSADERAALETMARTVPGCRDVDNQLTPWPRIHYGP